MTRDQKQKPTKNKKNYIMWDSNKYNKLWQDNDEVYCFKTYEIHSHSLTLNNGPLKLHNDKSVVSV